MPPTPFELGKMCRKKSKIGNFRVPKHKMNKRIDSTDSLCIHICLTRLFQGNKYEKILIFKENQQKH